MLLRVPRAGDFCMEKGIRIRHEIGTDVTDDTKSTKSTNALFGSTNTSTDKKYPIF